MSLPFSQRLRPMKGTRYFASANDAASQGWIRNFRMIYCSQHSLVVPSTRATASILKRREARAFAIVMRKCVFMNDKVRFLTLFSVSYCTFTINLLNTFRHNESIETYSRNWILWKIQLISLAISFVTILYINDYCVIIW